MHTPRLAAVLLLALAETALPLARSAERLAEFRSLDRTAAFDISLKETERYPRYSLFTASAPISDQPKAMFVLCSFGEFAVSRGYTHLAIIEPPPGKSVYVVGLFDSENEDLRQVFGNERDLSKVLGQKPGEAARINSVCGSKP